MRRVTARDGTTLALHEVGDGPPLLCVPGGPGRAAEYLEDLGGLSASRTLLLLDNRGTGASELPADRESLRLDRLPDDVEDVRATLELEPLDVLGHSAGCPVALLHAARHPDRVRKVVVVTPSGMPFGWPPDDLDSIRAARSSEPWYAEAAEAQAALQDNPRFARELEPLTRPFWYGSWDERAQTHAAGADMQMSLRANAGYRPNGDYDPVHAREALRAITARVLIICGERDALTGVSVASQFCSVLQHCEVAVLPRAGHFPWIDQPDRFSSVVREFLTN